MHIKDEIGNATVWVGDCAQRRRRAVGDEGLSRCPIVAWKQDNLRRSTVLASVKASSPVFLETHPALRMAVTAACTEAAHALMSGTSCGSFIL